MEKYLSGTQKDRTMITDTIGEMMKTKDLWDKVREQRN